MEYDQNGRVKSRYIHGLGIDEHLAVEKKDEVYYYHADGLGSITALTDKKQKVVQTYEYDSFGNVKQHDGKVKQPFTFTGREWDEETGLYYYRARYYDPKIGTFISKDPIGLAGGINLYAYVGNNPVNLTDPYGLFEWVNPYTYWRDFFGGAPDPGQQITNAAKNWAGTPYVTGGKTKAGADCSGAVCGIYTQAGYPYPYSPTSTFGDNPYFTPVSSPQAGDVCVFPGHMVIYDPNAGKNRGCQSASRPGGRPFGPANTSWYPGPMQCYRYVGPN